jgi:alpha-beta hydrolase superfamily lysophospholipase
MTAPRFLYLHGFASGPQSAKGVALTRHFAGHGVALERLDLRLPSLERLRLSAMMARVAEAMGGPRDRAVLLGSSLGGLTAARVAERDARACALVLLAPAFRLAERWLSRMGEAAWHAWREANALVIDDYTTGLKTEIDFEFIRELERLDSDGDGWPDVRVPVLIIHGVNDATVDVALSRAWAQGKRHVRLVEVDDGHDLMASLPRIRDEIDGLLAPFGIGRG